jgi:hypothetical protein
MAAAVIDQEGNRILAEGGIDAAFAGSRVVLA